MILIAFTNAAIRELLLMKYINELRSHQISTLVLILLCAIYVSAIFTRLDIRNLKEAVIAGITWFMLTVVFEFSLGRLTGKSWAYLFQNYNISEGHLWPFFLLTLLLLPSIFQVVRNR